MFMIVYDCHVFAVNIINFVNYAYFLFVECRQNCCEAVGYASTHMRVHTRGNRKFILNYVFNTKRIYM